jgi:hypothetical protein
MNAMITMNFTELRVSTKHRCFSDGFDLSFNLSLWFSFHPIEIFHDYGFIEGMPQRWAIEELDLEMEAEEDGEIIDVLIHGENCIFDLQANKLGEIKVDFTKINTEFNVMEESQKTIQLGDVSDWFRENLRSLNWLRNIVWDQYDHKIPQHEWDSIWAFHKAYAAALKYAIMDAEKHIQNFENDTVCYEFESLDINHYDNFRKEEDDVDYREQTCNSSEYTDFRSYQPHAKEKSNYQTMLWQH